LQQQFTIGIGVIQVRQAGYISIIREKLNWNKGNNTILEFGIEWKYVSNYNVNYGSLMLN